jgi:hypothetical protein
MKVIQRGHTRRHLLRIARGIAAATAASIPIVLSVESSAFAGKKDDRDDDRDRDHRDNHRDKSSAFPGEKNDRDRDHRDKRSSFAAAQKGPGLSCFLRGTTISTALGERPVEELEVGDEVRTFNGLKKIKWVGYDRYKKTAGAAWIETVMPVRVARFAIDDHTPQRDLYISGAHCLFLGGVLIPADHLINDITINRGTPSGLESIEYYHIEFETHEVIYAEGVAVESYLGTNRENFSNFVQYERLYGVDHQPKTPFAPIVGYYGGRDELKGLVRSVISNIVDVRDPVQIAWDRIAERAEAMV